MSKTEEQIVAEIKSLKEDVLVESNDGTHAKDPQCFTWHTYETIDGTRYTVGKKGEGYARHHKFESCRSRQAQIDVLQWQLAAIQTDAKTRRNHVEQLHRGWDGYQFVGVAEGQRRAAE